MLHTWPVDPEACSECIWSRESPPRAKFIRRAARSDGLRELYWVCHSARSGLFQGTVMAKSSSGARVCLSRSGCQSAWAHSLYCSSSSGGGCGTTSRSNRTVSATNARGRKWSSTAKVPQSSSFGDTAACELSIALILFRLVLSRAYSVSSKIYLASSMCCGDSQTDCDSALRAERRGQSMATYGWFGFTFK